MTELSLIAFSRHWTYIGALIARRRWTLGHFGRTARITYRGRFHYELRIAEYR